MNYWAEVKEILKRQGWVSMEWYEEMVGPNQEPSICLTAACAMASGIELQTLMHAADAPPGDAGKAIEEIIYDAVPKKRWRELVKAIEHKSGMLFPEDGMLMSRVTRFNDEGHVYLEFDDKGGHVFNLLDELILKEERNNAATAPTSDTV